MFNTQSFFGQLGSDHTQRMYQQLNVLMRLLKHSLIRKGKYIGDLSKLKPIPHKSLLQARPVDVYVDIRNGEILILEKLITPTEGHFTIISIDEPTVCSVCSTNLSTLPEDLEDVNTNRVEESVKQDSQKTGEYVTGVGCIVDMNTKYPSCGAAEDVLRGILNKGNGTGEPLCGAILKIEKKLTAKWEVFDVW